MTPVQVSADHDDGEGLAIGIMVGLLFGTVITLVFIPSLFSILFRVDYRDYRFDPALLD